MLTSIWRPQTLRLRADVPSLPPLLRHCLKQFISTYSAFEWALIRNCNVQIATVA